MPLYKLKKGTRAFGSTLDGSFRVYKSNDPLNNIIDDPDELLASKEPERYERVGGVSAFGNHTSSGTGEQYNMPHSAEQVDAEIARLTQLAKLMREKEKGKRLSSEEGTQEKDSASTPSPQQSPQPNYSPKSEHASDASTPTVPPSPARRQEAPRK